MKKYKRKKLNLSVKRHFQIWLLIRILGVVLLSSFMAAIILYFFSRTEITDSFYTAHIKLRRVSDLLLPVVAAGSAVSLVSGVFLALFLPQKIAGPLFRLEQRLVSLQEGDLSTEVRLRKNDTLKEFAQSVNHATSTLREKMKRVQETQAELEAHFEKSEDIKPSLEQQKKNLSIFKT